jgi:hypothetical protein
VEKSLNDDKLIVALRQKLHGGDGGRRGGGGDGGGKARGRGTTRGRGGGGGAEQDAQIARQERIILVREPQQLSHACLHAGPLATS